MLAKFVASDRFSGVCVDHPYLDDLPGNEGVSLRQSLRLVVYVVVVAGIAMALPWLKDRQVVQVEVVIIRPDWGQYWADAKDPEYLVDCFLKPEPSEGSIWLQCDGEEYFVAEVRGCYPFRYGLNDMLKRIPEPPVDARLIQRFECEGQCHEFEVLPVLSTRIGETTKLVRSSSPMEDPINE